MGRRRRMRRRFVAPRPGTTLSHQVKKYFFSQSGKSHEKPDLDVPRWMGAHLTYLEISAGKDKQVIVY
jgi:hypothetical protein